MPVTSVLAICGAVAFVAFELVLRRRDAATTSWTANDDDRGSTRLIVGCYAAIIALNVMLAGTSTGRLPGPARWLGVMFMLAGLGLRAWAMNTLGRYYTRTLRTSDGQGVIEQGPYRLLRHPGYSGSLLVWVGYSLALGNALAAVATGALLAAVYVWRIGAEEAMLSKAFGAQYDQYRARTKRLVPFVY